MGENQIEDFAKDLYRAANIAARSASKMPLMEVKGPNVALVWRELPEPMREVVREQARWLIDNSIYCDVPR